MTWYAIEITEACLLGGAYHRLCRAFQQAFIAAGAPADMALFAGRGAFDESRVVYLSPASVPILGELIAEYDGRPCDCPDAGLVTLVYGVPGVKARLLESPAEQVSHTPAVSPVATQDACCEGVPIYPLHTSRPAAAGA